MCTLCSWLFQTFKMFRICAQPEHFGGNTFTIHVYLVACSKNVVRDFVCAVETKMEFKFRFLCVCVVFWGNFIRTLNQRKNCVALVISHPTYEILVHLLMLTFPPTIAHFHVTCNTFSCIFPFYSLNSFNIWISSWTIFFATEWLTPTFNGNLNIARKIII